MSARIPPAPSTGHDDDIQAMLDASTTYIGGAQNVLLTLANHPGLFRKYAPFSGKLLQGKLPVRERELLILRTGFLCDSEYEWGQHARMGRDAGLTDAEILRITVGPDDPAWSDGDRLLLRAADSLVIDHTVEDDTWRALAVSYDDKQMVEIVLLVGFYVMIAGFLNAVQVEREPGVEGFPAT